ncbi:MAG: galactose-1-phosphate uridylyltransferase [Candidatus Thorarchaeota archaeon]
MGYLRWNRMLGEWVIVTPDRADRPFQDKKRACPFCPGGEETEGDWEVLTLENRFPSLELGIGLIPLDREIVMEAPGFGACKIIVTSRDHDMQVENMDDKQLEMVFQEYIKTFRELDSTRGIEYVFMFENRGKSIGVSLDHPHTQVYALPFIPPLIQREIDQARTIWNKEGVCLVCHTLEKEVESGQRIIKESENFVSLVPFSARLPYEVHIYPRQHVASLLELEEHLLELGQMIRDIAHRYTKVFDEMAYVMAFHTQPSSGEFPYWHFHVEFYPPWRDRGRIKYLAGIETGAGTYTNDSIPEEKALELREAK